MAKPFPNSVVEKAWARAGGKCECKRKKCNHKIPHGKSLRWESRGKETDLGWEAHHIDSNGEPVLSNCLILCMPCHKATQTYGK